MRACGVYEYTSLHSQTYCQLSKSVSLSLVVLKPQDIPYFSYKRSEQIGHQVRTYLTNKWGVAFPNTGIWNYVRYVFLPFITLEGDTLPREWADQAAIFYSWFESLGFNRYNGQMLPEFIDEPNGNPVIRDIDSTLASHECTCARILHQ